MCAYVSQVVTFRGFTTKIVYIFLISPMHAECLTHLIHLDLIIVILLGEGCKL
jgi:hypothetical protein